MGTQLAAGLGSTQPTVQNPNTLNVFGSVIILNAWYGQSIGNGGMDVTSQFCRQIAAFPNYNGPITINNNVLGGDPTPGIAKAIFVTFNLTTSPGSTFLYFQGPIAGENYQVSLPQIIQASSNIYPGTFTTNGPGRVRVLQAWWCGYNAAPPNSWTLNPSTWPAGVDVTGLFWTILSANGNQQVPANVKAFSDPMFGTSKKMIMVYEKDIGSGYGSRIGLYVAYENAVITYSSFPSLMPITITVAEYSDSSFRNNVDVTNIVIAAFSLSDTFFVSDANLGGDPYPGQSKTLIIGFHWNSNPNNMLQYIGNFPAGGTQWISISQFPTR